MKKLIVLTIAVFMLTGLLMAQKDMQGTPDPNPKLKPRLVDDGTGIDRYNEELKLTEAQIKNLDDLRLNHQKQMNLLDAEIQNLEMDIQKAMQNEDYAGARKLTQQLNEKQLSRANAQITHRENVMKQLTPEQKAVAPAAFMRGMGDNHRMGYMGKCPDMKPGMTREQRSNPMHVLRNARRMHSNMKDCGNCENHKGN